MNIRTSRIFVIIVLSTLSLFVYGVLSLSLIIPPRAIASFYSGVNDQKGNKLIHQGITASPTPLNTSSQEDQQVLAESKDNVNFANALVTWSGLFLSGILAVFTLIGAIVSFFGIREIRSIRQLSRRSQRHLANVVALENQVEGQLEQLDKRFERDSQMIKDRFEQLNGRFENAIISFNTRIKDLSEHFEEESQKFMEASYLFSTGSGAYKIGDNVHAIEHFLQALQLQPKNVRTLERLGRAFSNLNEMDKAIDYLNQALEINDSYVPALRSLALCYRYTDKLKAIEYLERAIKVNPLDFEAWDFLGLFYRDQGFLDKAINAHEEALKLKKRPETQFYLSILYAQKGDKEGAKIMAMSASYDLNKQEHDQRVRPVWKLLIHSGVFILNNDKDEAMKYIRTLKEYITTQRICDAVAAHLQFLLNATGHSEWLAEFMEIVKVKGIPDVAT